MVDFARVDHNIVGVNDDAVVSSVKYLAIFQCDVIADYLHKIRVGPTAVDPVVLVDTRLGNNQATDLLRICQTTNIPTTTNPGLGRGTRARRAIYALGRFIRFGIRRDREQNSYDPS